MCQNIRQIQKESLFDKITDMYFKKKNMKLKKKDTYGIINFKRKVTKCTQYIILNYSWQLNMMNYPELASAHRKKIIKDAIIRNNKILSMDCELLGIRKL